jgi:hypothetical protein
VSRFSVELLSVCSLYPTKNLSSGDFCDFTDEVIGVCMAIDLIIALAIGRDHDLFSETLLWTSYLN